MLVVILLLVVYFTTFTWTLVVCLVRDVPVSKVGSILLCWSSGFGLFLLILPEAVGIIMYAELTPSSPLPLPVIFAQMGAFVVIGIGVCIVAVVWAHRATPALRTPGRGFPVRWLAEN